MTPRRWNVAAIAGIAAAVLATAVGGPLLLTQLGRGANPDTFVAASPPGVDSAERATSVVDAGDLGAAFSVAEVVARVSSARAAAGVGVVAALAETGSSASSSAASSADSSGSGGSAFASATNSGATGSATAQARAGAATADAAAVPGVVAPCEASARSASSAPSLGPLALVAQLSYQGRQAVVLAFQGSTGVEPLTVLVLAPPGCEVLAEGAVP